MSRKNKALLRAIVRQVAKHEIQIMVLDATACGECGAQVMFLPGQQTNTCANCGTVVTRGLV